MKKMDFFGCNLHPLYTSNTTGLDGQKEFTERYNKLTNYINNLGGNINILLTEVGWSSCGYINKNKPFSNTE